MAELQGFIFKTQALHLYRSFLRAIKGAPAGSQGKAFLWLDFLSKTDDMKLHEIKLQRESSTVSA